MLLTLLLSVFRMVVLPVEFQDRQFVTSREQQEVLVQQAEDYFNKQFAVPVQTGTYSSYSNPLIINNKSRSENQSGTGSYVNTKAASKAIEDGMTFEFVLGLGVTLGHSLAYYGRIIRTGRISGSRRRCGRRATRSRTRSISPYTIMTETGRWTTCSC